MIVAEQLIVVKYRYVLVSSTDAITFSIVVTFGNSSATCCSMR